MRQARALVDAGHRIRWATAPPRGVRGHTELPGYRRMSPARSDSKVRGPLAAALAQVGGARRRGELAAKFDPWFRRVVRSVDAVIAADEPATAMLGIANLFEPGITCVPPSQAAATLAEQKAWDDLTTTADTVLAAGKELRTEPAPVRNLLRSMQALPPAATLATVHLPGLYGLLAHLVRTANPVGVLDVIEAAKSVPGAHPQDPVLAGFTFVATLDQGGGPIEPPPSIAKGVLRSADAALDAGDLDTTATLATLALDVLFHRELHSDVPRSDLVEDPAGYVQVLRDSHVGALLTGSVPDSRPAPAMQTPVPSPEEPRTRSEVLVLPGPYGSTHEPVVQALRGARRTKVRTSNVRRKHSTFRTMKTDPAVVRLRLQYAMTGGGRGFGSLRNAVARADVVFANWADKAAVLASLAAAPTTRLTIRVHSVDALRPWLHLVDWNRVQHLICVSRHIADLVRDLLGDRLAGTGVHVVPNVIDVNRFQVDKPADASRVLCMVGWAQRVKDPLWTLEVLARLRARDSRWRLLLIGADFANNLPLSGRRYADEFRHRAMADDVRAAIEYVGFTEDVPAQVRRAGFVLSSSVRESWHVGAIEAVAAGAVPVVRDWPLFAHRGGARRLFPEDWVVDDVAQAVDRIEQFSDSRAWAEESVRTRRMVHDLTDALQSARDLRRIVLGSTAELTDLVAQGDDERATTLIHHVLHTEDPDPLFLREAIAATRISGEAQLRFDLLERLAEHDTDPRVLTTMRHQLGRLRETSPDWAPTIPGQPKPITAVPDRVLHVLKLSMPYRESGYAVRSMYTLRGQRALGIDAIAATALDFPADASSSSSTEEEVAGVRHRRLLREGIPAEEPVDAYLDAWAALLYRVVEEERPDVIHVHSGHRGFEAALVALSVGRAAGRPVLYEVRGFFESLWSGDPDRAERGESYRRRRETEERCMRAAAAVVTLSEPMRQDIIARGIDPDRVHVVPNAVDAEAFPPRQRSEDLVRKWGLQDRFVFGYVSNLDHYREGHELLIEAAIALRRQGIPATALIVGGGRREQELHELAERSGAGDAVVFTGRIAHEQVHDYYALMDLFVIPRVDERAARLVTPLKPYEAMALGVPLLVSDLPALLEVIGAGERGQAFRSGQVDSLIEAILAARADSHALTDRAARARRWVLTERTWEANARRYQQIYDSLDRSAPHWPANLSSGPESTVTTPAP